MTSVDDVLAVLGEVVDPCSVATGVPLSILDMGLLRSLAIEGDRVTVDLRLTSPLCHQAPYFVLEVERRLAGLPGVAAAECRTDIGMEWDPAMMTTEARARLATYRDALDARAAGQALPLLTREDA